MKTNSALFSKSADSLFRPLLISLRKSRTWDYSRGNWRNFRAQKCKTNDASDFLEFARENSNFSAIFDSSSFFLSVSTFQSQTRLSSMRDNYQFFPLPFVNYSTVDCHNCEIEIHIFPLPVPTSSNEVLIFALFIVVAEEFREKKHRAACSKKETSQHVSFGEFPAPSFPSLSLSRRSWIKKHGKFRLTPHPYLPPVWWPTSG